MVSTLKSETARANGAKSRGPTTPEGKEKSSRNSIKHGLTAGNGNILLDCEDKDEFDGVLNKLLGIHQPGNPAEKDVVEEMFAARWRIRRMWTVETNLLNVEIVAQQSKLDPPDPTFTWHRPSTPCPTIPAPWRLRTATKPVSSASTIE